MTRSRTLPDALRRHGWTIFWSLLGIALLYRTGVRDRGVIIDHLEFGRRVLFGNDLYAPYLEDKPLHAPYPPAFGLMTGPFGLLPERLARFAWGALQVTAIWIIARRLRDLGREFQPQLLKRLNLLYLLVTIVAARYILRDTHGGGGNLINLALVLTAMHHARYRRPIRAGLWLGFSLATKPVAILVLPWMWLLGQRRAPAYAIGSAIGFTALALVLLRQGMVPFLTWFDGSMSYAAMTNLFEPPAQGFPPFTWMNQCLRCGIARFCGEVPAEFATQIPNFTQGLGLSHTATSWIARAANATLLAITLAQTWRLRNTPAARPFLIAAVLGVSLLLSPISWKAHHVALIPTLFWIGAQALRGRRVAIALLIGYVLICGLGQELVGKQFKGIQQSFYFTTLGTIVLWAWCMLSAQRAGRPAA